MNHLIYTNVLVVFLDISLLGMSYSPFFYVQAAYKPCVYGVKLRVEFSILNRLVQTLRGASIRSYDAGADHSRGGIPPSGRAEWHASHRNEVRLETYTPQSEVNIMPSKINRNSTHSIGDGMFERVESTHTRVDAGPSQLEEATQSGKSLKGA